MIQISIKKQEQITNQASFASSEEAQQWLSYHEGLKSFGEPARVVQQQVEISPAVVEKQSFLIKEAQFDDLGNELSPAEYEERDILIQEAVFEMQEQQIPASYEIIIEDITAQVEQEKINAEALAFLAATDWMVIRALEKGLELSAEFMEGNRIQHQIK